MRNIDPEYLQSEVERALACLTERERQVIEQRFALNGHEPGYAQSLEWIAKNLYTYPVTRERIRQIEAKALRKIREHVERDWSGYAWWRDIARYLAFMQAVEQWPRKEVDIEH